MNCNMEGTVRIETDHRDTLSSASLLYINMIVLAVFVRIQAPVAESPIVLSYHSDQLLPPSNNRLNAMRCRTGPRTSSLRNCSSEMLTQTDDFVPRTFVGREVSIMPGDARRTDGGFRASFHWQFLSTLLPGRARWKAIAEGLRDANILLPGCFENKVDFAR